jgi:hypothetical protein
MKFSEKAKIGSLDEDTLKMLKESSTTIRTSLLKFLYKAEFPSWWQLGRNQHNPFYPIEAYKVARKVGGDIPKWVLEYFDRLSEGKDRLPNNRDTKNANTLYQNVNLAIEAKKLKEETNKNWDVIESELAIKHGVGEDRVQSARKKLARWLDSDGREYLT